MTEPVANAVRPPSLIDQTTTFPNGSAGHWEGRGQNFLVSWTRAGRAGARTAVDSADEAMVIVLDASVRIWRDGETSHAPARSICLLPAGKWTMELQPGATCAVLTSLRDNQQTGALNESSYALRDTRIAPVGPALRALQPDKVRVLSIDAVAAPKDKPRLKMLQSATLSINWVEYDGPRDRRQLSPHAHSAFEQGSLALAGEFVHHLRVEWTQDATEWVDDVHAPMGSPSLMVVPVNTVHTSEGTGAGHHLLIDIFCPPRADFIAKGWVANSGDYASPGEAA